MDYTRGAKTNIKSKDKLVDRVKNPDEVLNGIHIHREQKTSKVSI